MNQTPHLDHVLHETRAKVRFAAVLTALLWSMAFVMGGVLLAVMLDGVLALPMVMRIVVDFALLALLLGAVVHVGRQFGAHAFDSRRLARLIEQRLGITTSALINTVDLAAVAGSGVGSTGSVSHELAGASVERGDAVAAKVDLRRVVDHAPMKRAAKWAGAVIGAAALLALIAPSLLIAVVPRYLDPLGDHPPFTLLKFDVSIEPLPLYYGQPATISTTIAGPDVPETASVVFVHDADATTPTREQRVPMLRREPGVFVLPIDRAEQSGPFYIDTPRGRSGRIEFNVKPTPLFESVALRYEPPAYTGRPVSQIALTGTGIRGLQGTRVTLTVRSNVALREGTVDIMAEEESPPIHVTLKPTQADAKVAEATLDLSFTGKRQMRLSLTGADGTPGLEPLVAPIVSVPDAPPRVRIEQPGMEVVAVEGWPVHVLVGADDDVAVSRLVLRRAVNGFAPSPTDLTLDSSTAGHASAAYVFDLKALGARGGDVITYFATAYDNYPADLGGPHATDSETYTIQVITMQEYQSFKRAEYGASQMQDEVDQYQRLMDDLQRRREEMLKEIADLQKRLTDQGGQMNDADKARLNDLLKQAEYYEQAMQRLADRLAERAGQPQLYENEKDYADMLKRLSEQLAQEAAAGKAKREQFQRDLTDRPQDADARTQQFLDEMAKQLGTDAEQGKAGSEQLDMAEQDLEKLRLAGELMNEAQRIVSLTQRQRDVADRLSELGAKQTLSDEEQKRADQLADQQAQLERDLKDALDQLDRLSKQAKEKLPQMAQSAAKIAAQIRDEQVPSDQATANREARAGRCRAAHGAADAAANKLESLIDEAQQQAEGQMAAGDLDGELKLMKSGLGQSLKQMAQARPVPGLQSRPSQANAKQGSSTGQARGRARLVGPHSSESGDRPSFAGQQGPGEAQQPGVGADPSRGGEAINPDAATNRAGVNASLIGVPLRDRAKAEAYLRRIAEESR